MGGCTKPSYLSSVMCSSELSVSSIPQASKGANFALHSLKATGVSDIVVIQGSYTQVGVHTDKHVTYSLVTYFCSVQIFAIFVNESQTAKKNKTCENLS